MNTYLTIITTVLVLTQVIRITQNHINLRRQNKLFKAELGQISEVTQDDLEVPDWRFGQLICNIPFDRDPFFMEEAEFLGCIKKMFNDFVFDDEECK